VNYADIIKDYTCFVVWSILLLVLLNHIDDRPRVERDREIWQLGSPEDSA
jgi:hypothetical protein